MDIVTGNRKCSKCGEVKHITEFSLERRKNRSEFRRYTCKPCDAKAARAYRLTHASSGVVDIEKKRASRREYERNRYAKIRGGSGKITDAEWNTLKKKYNYTCLCCGRAEPEIKLTIDHVVPVSMGGSNTIENAQPLCGFCNLSKHAKTIDYRPLWGEVKIIDNFLDSR